MTVVPGYTHVGLDGWQAAVGLKLPLPPTEPSTWTCLLCAFGPGVFYETGDNGSGDLDDAAFLRALVTAAGRPVRSEEQPQLLLVTPLPGETDWVDVLTQVSAHSSFQVRQSAALVFGHLGDPRAIPVLERLSADRDNDVRRAAAEALGRLGHKALIGAWLRAEPDSDESVDLARVEAIVRTEAWSEARAALALADADAGTAVDAEAEEDDEESEEEDEEDDEDDDEEEATPRTLLRVILAAEADDDLAPLTSYLSGEHDDLDRVALRFVLASPGRAPGVLDALLAKLDRGEDDSTAELLCEALALTGEEGLEGVADRLESDDWVTRMLAARVFSWVSPEAGAPYVARLEARLSDNDQDVVRAVALALLWLGAGQGRPETALSNILYGGNAALRRMLRVSERVPGLKIVAPLLEKVRPSEEFLALLLQRTYDDELVCRAAVVAGLVDPALAAPALEAISRDEPRDIRTDIRRAAAAGLFLTGVTPVKVPLVQRILLAHQGDVDVTPGGSVELLQGREAELVVLALEDGDGPVRLDAVGLLGRLGPEIVARYRALFAHVGRTDPEADVRTRASELAEAPWGPRQSDLAILFAAVGEVHDDDARAAALWRLHGARPALAARFAAVFVEGDSRPLAQAGAEMLGARAAGPEAEALARSALGRLEADGWIARELACALLGSIRRDEIPPGLLEEVVEGLKGRGEDDDDDVKQAAARALTRLGS